MATVIATPTVVAMQYWPQFFGGLTGGWSPQLTVFKIGRGGWIDPGGGPIPRVPDPTLEDLDIIQNGPSGTGTRYAGTTGNIYFWRQVLISGNFSLVSTTTLNIKCILDFTSFNDIQGVPSDPPDGGTLSPSGTNPQLWELGVFSPAPPGYTSPTVAYGSDNLLMIAYGTFGAQTKTSGIQLENDMCIVFPVLS